MCTQGKSTTFLLSMLSEYEIAQLRDDGRRSVRGPAMALSKREEATSTLMQLIYYSVRSDFPLLFFLRRHPGLVYVHQLGTLPSPCPYYRLFSITLLFICHTLNVFSSCFLSILLSRPPLYTFLHDLSFLVTVAVDVRYVFFSACLISSEVMSYIYR